LSTHILLIEDSPDDARLTQRFLARRKDARFTCQHVARLSDGLAALAVGGFDLVLLDLDLPDSAGLDTAKAVCEAAPDLPVIVLSGNGREDLAVQALRVGAQDYLEKDHQADRTLVRAIRYALDRKKRAVALRNSEARYRVLIDGSADGILATDIDGVVRYANEMAAQLLGRPRAALIGSSFGVPVIESESTEIEHLGAHGRIVRMEMRLMKSTWEGEEAHFITLHDVTDRVNARELARRLEAESLLVKHLQELDREKVEFVDTVTHEIRSPLTPLSSALELFLDGLIGDLTPRQRDMMAMMHRNVQRLARYATEILALSKLDSGTYPIEIHEQNLADVVRPVVDLLRPAAAEKKIELSLCGAEDAVAFADEDALCQVVTNLVNNALAHTPEGTHVQVELRAARDGMAELWVRDDGPGIAPDVQKKLFDRFFQADRKKGGAGYKGTGIGLAICKSLVDRMGGQIELSSRPGEGTIFRVGLRTDPVAPEFLFGQVAHRLGYISQDHLREVTRLQQAMQGTSTRIGDLLVAQGYLKEEQRDEVLSVRGRNLARPHPHKVSAKVGDSLLGALAQVCGYITEDELNECLREQQRLKELGDERRLGEVLVSQGRLSSNQVLELLATQGRCILACEGCHDRFNGGGAHDDEHDLTCPRCGSRLIEAQDVDDLRVEGDLR
jgi:signal transduction histidine kinase